MRDVLVRHGLVAAHEGLPLVVLADVEHRQLPGHGEVDRLVEDAFAGGAVAEEDGGDAAGLGALVGIAPIFCASATPGASDSSPPTMVEVSTTPSSLAETCSEPLLPLQ